MGCAVVLCFWLCIIQPPHLADYRLHPWTQPALFPAAWGRLFPTLSWQVWSFDMVYQVSTLGLWSFVIPNLLSIFSVFFQIVPCSVYSVFWSSLGLMKAGRMALLACQICPIDSTLHPLPKITLLSLCWDKGEHFGASNLSTPSPFLHSLLVGMVGMITPSHLDPWLWCYWLHPKLMLMLTSRSSWMSGPGFANESRAGPKSLHPFHHLIFYMCFPP